MMLHKLQDPGRLTFRETKKASTDRLQVGLGTARRARAQSAQSATRFITRREFCGFQLVKKGFDKLVDGEASSPARCRASNLRFEPSAVSPKAKPENPKGFQPPCHPHQFLLKSKRFPGAKTARERFFLWKMGFSGVKIAPCPPYMPLAPIESSKGLRPSRALPSFLTVWKIPPD